MKHLAIFVLVWGTIISAKSQVVISPIPHPQGHFGLDDIWRVNLISAQPKAVTAQLEVIVEDAQHGLVLTATSPVFNLMQGNNRPVFNPSGSKMQYGKSNITQILRSTGRFPYGNYVVCYRLLAADHGNLLAEFCQEELMQPFAPPELINPYNGEEINTVFPILVWKPPFPPGTIPIEYILKLVEIKSRQHLVEALEKNAPIINRLGLFSTSLPYPVDVPKLEIGKSYAWQVSARAGGFELGVTEVWEFKVAEVAKSEAHNIPGVFRELKLSPEGSYNLIKQKLRFKFENRWGAAFLDSYLDGPFSKSNSFCYIIYPAGQQESPLKAKGAISLTTGTNLITIDLSETKGIKPGENYLLVLRDPIGKQYYLEFTYTQ